MAFRSFLSILDQVFRSGAPSTMHLDVLDLRSFYYRTGLGRAAQKAIRTRMLEFWPDADGLSVAGFGFAAPLLRPYIGRARQVIALMPGQQGVMPWPAGEPNMSVLCEETLWPLERGSVDRMILMHGLDTSENPFAVLEECYRVMAPEGRALIIVPNRSGLWARNDRTPFGFGRPYSLGQLDAQIKSHDFIGERALAALYQPPSAHRFWMRTGPFWEGIGGKLTTALAGGVILYEVKKQVPAPPRRGIAAAMRKPLRVLDGIAQPAGNPA